MPKSKVDKLDQVAKQHSQKTAPRTTPLWAGPSGNGPNGGISFSMLSRWLNDKERFRVSYIEGLQAQPKFNHYLEFGQMWHICEEAHAARKDGKGPEWFAENGLTAYVKELLDKYPLDGQEIDKWYNVVKIMFPEYMKFWSEHPDMIKREPLLQEQTFDVPYRLPSGRTVRLRGKWDSVDLVRDQVWLQENKTKSKIDVTKLERQLKFDLQTMMYLVALDYLKELSVCGGTEDPLPEKICDNQLAGIRYNVVRRDLPIRGHQPTKKNPKGESKAELYERFRRDYLQTEPEKWFVRFNVEVSQEDIDKFKRTCLNPMLEALCNWYEIQCGRVPTFNGDSCLTCGIHWRHPYGVRNMIDEGGITDLDNYLDTGSKLGLVRTETLFGELQ